MIIGRTLLGIDHRLITESAFIILPTILELGIVFCYIRIAAQLGNFMLKT